jgi:hypothetical protein
MNSVMERWIQSCRHELLDRTLIWNQAHPLHALREHELHYNRHPATSGYANARPLHPLPEPIPIPPRSHTYAYAGTIASTDSSTNTIMQREPHG